jgi:hypothetical protein
MLDDVLDHEVSERLLLSDRAILRAARETRAGRAGARATRTA